MRPDGSLERMTGAGGVAMTLPAANDEPARTIRASTLDAQAANDGTLTGARFAENVKFEEAGSDSKRAATSDVLTLDLSDSSISRALFHGNATFTDGDLRSTAAQARYEPTSGRLELRGRDQRGDPAVADARVTIEAERIDIALESKRIEAQGRVKSTLLSAKDGQAKNGDKTTQLPGLLKQDQPARLTADAVTYDADAGVAVYTGRAWLSQGDTEIRAHSIELQQKAGDLIARGGVRSRFLFDDGRRSEGEAEELRYADEKRTMTYLATAPTGAAATGTAPDKPPAGSGGAGKAATAHLTGPQGDLRGRRITIFLATAESRLERLEAEDDVLAKVSDARTARGATLTYRARDESYTIKGTSARPASVEENTTAEGCREVKGGTLTFNRSADTMDVDGQGERRAKWQQKASCQ
jgi:lipopolysaccharide export system protein LptA